MGKISGPLLDRIDLHIEVPAVAYQELRGKETGATSAEMRERVLAARAVQAARGSINATVPAGRVRDICPLDAAAEKTLEMAVRRLALSARAHDRILKVSRTIADLGGSEQDQIQIIGPSTSPRRCNTARSTGSSVNEALL
jgi:magnesium chelatase family protein